MKVAALLLVFATAFNAGAGEPNSTPQDIEGMDALTEALDQSVVSAASQSAQTSTLAPATVTNITAEELHRYGIKSLNEALNFLSLGMVTQDPLHSVDVGARGVLLTADFGNHVLLLLDGQILNEPWDGTAYFERGLAVPWEMIDHIEVVLGPGSILYGSNAMLGVVNVVTRTAHDYGTFRATIDGNFASPVDANDAIRAPSLAGSYWGKAGRDVRVAAGGGLKFTLLGLPGEVLGQLDYYGSHGTAFTFGPLNYGNDQVTGLPKNFGPRSLPGIWGGVAEQSFNAQVPTGLVKATFGNLEVSLRVASNWRSTPYIGHFNVFYGDFDNPHDGELDRFLNLNARYHTLLTPKLGVSARLYGALYDYTQSITSSATEDCPSALSSGCRLRIGGASTWGGLEVQGRYDWLLDGRWTTLVGADGRLRRVSGLFGSSDLYGDLSATHIPYQRNESVLGIYVQQEALPLPHLHLNAGLRLDADSRFRAQLSPRVAVAYELGRTGTVKFIYSEAFRAPNAYELYFQDGLTQVAPQSLRPETVRAAEASYEQVLGPLRFRGGPFVSRWYDMVLLTQLTPAQLAAAINDHLLLAGSTGAVEYKNVSHIDNVGLDASVEGRLGSRVRYGLNATVARTRRYFQDDSSPQPLTVAPQFFGNARVSYQAEKESPIYGLAVFFAGRRPADQAFNGTFLPPPYAPPEVDLRLSISGPFSKIPGLSYRITGGYAFATQAPYVAGPTTASPVAELAPVDRLRMGLQLIEQIP